MVERPLYTVGIAHKEKGKSWPPKYPQFVITAFQARGTAQAMVNELNDVFKKYYTNEPADFIAMVGSGKAIQFEE
jgi:hypothetical protein